MSKAETEANAMKIAEFFLLASALIDDEPDEDEDDLLDLDDEFTLIRLQTTPWKLWSLWASTG